MSWLGLLLIGVAVTDLGHSLRPRPWLPEIAGAAAVVVTVLLAGLVGPWDLLAAALVLVVVLGWATAVRHGLDRDRPWLPLTLLGGAVTAAVACAPWAGEGGGPLGEWLAAAPWQALAGVEVGQLLAVTGGLLVQCSTGNLVVRLVLSLTDTTNPVDAAGVGTALKGGRLLGPMERVVILGLGLAGQVTAASLVIAAKGLIRWPEIQSFRRSDGGPSITDVTEYFLLGSFVSWLVALATLVLVMP
ncbi:hypothetical protein KUV85_06660 [Nocardioides panacisoli]|uniref:hypothetical protein n=1 Tax=Nocardioides panacisoli TaxID=627624 RepID=UPI001C62AF4B|nr:hypothetical protein [Nocardioides panacisoli]QYJ05354.1 hypothetical protein KUV85_06660 [Nocardioides panacisoli]